MHQVLNWTETKDQLAETKLGTERSLSPKLINSRDVRILRAENFAQNPPPCTEFGVLCRTEENLPNGTDDTKILLIFVNPFTYNYYNYTVYPLVVTPLPPVGHI